MTEEEAIKSLRKMAFKSHPLNIENDCVNLESAIELVEELFEQTCIKHGVMQAEGSDSVKGATVGQRSVDTNTVGGINKNKQTFKEQVESLKNIYGGANRAGSSYEEYL